MGAAEGADVLVGAEFAKTTIDMWIRRRTGWCSVSRRRTQGKCGVTSRGALEGRRHRRRYCFTCQGVYRCHLLELVEVVHVPSLLPRPLKLRCTFAQRLGRAK